MARNQDIPNETEQFPVQPNPYAGYVPLTYRMVSSGITPAPRPSMGMVQLAPVVLPLSVMPYASDQGYYGDDQQY